MKDLISRAILDMLAPRNLKVNLTRTQVTTMEWRRKLEQLVINEAKGATRAIEEDEVKLISRAKQASFTLQGKGKTIFKKSNFELRPSNFEASQFEQKEDDDATKRLEKVEKSTSSEGEDSLTSKEVQASEILVNLLAKDVLRTFVKVAGG